MYVFFMPEVVAQDGDRVRARHAVFFRQKRAAQRGLNVEHVEVVARHQFTQDHFAAAAVAEAERGRIVGR